MTKSAEEESTLVELEGRPHRLGIGATVPRQSTVGPSNDPIERKLHSKLEPGKRKAARISEESSVSARAEEHHNKIDEEEYEDENLDSRTNLFAKRRPEPMISSSQAKKRHK
ncbi:hypothetical protein U1Q18_028987 [Sarracenia purpurea var. burkii]